MSRIAGLLAAGFVALLVAAGAAPASAQTPDQACVGLTNFADATRPNLPQPIDDITEVTDLVVDCTTEVLVFVLRFTVPPEQLPADAVEQARNAFLVGSCQQGIAAATGWTLAGEFRAADGTVTARFDTTADDCATVATAAAGEVAAYVGNVAAAFPAPLPLDDTIEIAAARADGTTLVLTVHLFGALPDPAAITADLGMRLVPVLCTTSQITALFRVGATINLSIVDDAGREALTLPLDPPACDAAAALGFPAGAPAAGVTDAMCTTAENVAADMRAALPIINDDGTEVTAVTVDCTAGTLTLAATFNGPTDLYAGTALAERETGHDVLHCALDQLAPGLGMTVVTEVRGIDGAFLAVLTTTPSECNFVTPAMVADTLPRLSPEGLAARLTEIVQTNAPGLPVRLNETLSLVSMFNGPNVLVVFYRIEGTFNPTQISTFAEQMRAGILANDCADPTQLQLLRAGATITYRYSDPSNNALFSVVVTPSDCGL